MPLQLFIELAVILISACADLSPLQGPFHAAVTLLYVGAACKAAFRLPGDKIREIILQLFLLHSIKLNRTEPGGIHDISSLTDTDQLGMSGGVLSSFDFAADLARFHGSMALQSHTSMETGEISSKIERGKHTTRHSELICVSEGTYIVDTPGFSSIELYGMEKEELQDYFPDFVPWEPECRFAGCAHVKERDCGVKRALERGEISASRYENYCQLYEELKGHRKY